MMTLWDMTPCTLVRMYQRFGRTCYCQRHSFSFTFLPWIWGEAGLHWNIEPIAPNCTVSCLKISQSLCTKCHGKIKSQYFYVKNCKHSLPPHHSSYSSSPSHLLIFCDPKILCDTYKLQILFCSTINCLLTVSDLDPFLVSTGHNKHSHMMEDNIMMMIWWCFSVIQWQEWLLFRTCRTLQPCRAYHR
jgi:hypothetical protein